MKLYLAVYSNESFPNQKIHTPHNIQTPQASQTIYNELAQFLSINAESIDTIELFNLYELQFYISLITNHDVEAKTCLDRLVDQFGFEKSQRVKLLKSIYFEAMGG